MEQKNTLSGKSVVVSNEEKLSTNNIIPIIILIDLVLSKNTGTICLRDLAGLPEIELETVKVLLLLFTLIFSHARLMIPIPI